MAKSLHVAYRNMARSSAIDAHIERSFSRLQQSLRGTDSCHVTIETLPPGDGGNTRYSVCIDLTTPDQSHLRSDEYQHVHSDVFIAISRAFDEVLRQIENSQTRTYVHRGDRQKPLSGRIIELFPDLGYGKIETAEGREVYFHRNSVLGDDFAKLKIGSLVNFTEDIGMLGPQATVLKLVSEIAERVY